MPKSKKLRNHRKTKAQLGYPKSLKIEPAPVLMVNRSRAEFVCRWLPMRRNLVCRGDRDLEGRSRKVEGVNDLSLV